MSTCRKIGFDILGLRVPDYSKQLGIKHQFWDWTMQIAAENKDRPFVIIGDFNTDPEYQTSKCGNRISQLIEEGWQHAIPKSGASYWDIKNGNGKRLDHAFVSRHFDILDAKYISESGSYVFSGKKSDAMSDHAVLLLEINRKPSNQL